MESEREALKSMTQYLFRKERTGEEYRYLRPSLDAEIGFIGIGAPTRIFLQDVAELFHTDADFPKYAMVANAIEPLWAAWCRNMWLESSLAGQRADTAIL